MPAEDGNSEETISAYFVFFSALLSVVLILSKLLHDRQRLASILPEAGMIVGVGMVAGALVLWVFGEERMGQVRGMEMDDDASNVDVHALVHNVLSFSPNAFFVALLPPIIFNSGYHLRRELFFRHIRPIALLAVVGTLVSTIAIATLLQMVKVLGWIGHGQDEEEAFAPTLTELLTFGALISATDPVSTLAVFQVKRVDPQLFYLVFGESVLNDAVGLVLFETFCKFVQRDNGAGKIAMGVMEFVVGFALDAVISPVLGWVCAVLAALLFKHIDLRNNTLLELALYLLIMYVPFLMAEILQLSGIVTILVTGIAARHYVEPNLSTQTQDIADVIFRLSAHLAETSIFLELGLSVAGVTEFLQWKFIGWSLVACLVARACHVYPIAFFFNQSLLLREQRQQQQKEEEEPCRVFFGYNIKAGMDGLMKMEFGQQNASQSVGNNKVDEANFKTTARKPMSGNLELTEHLNDFYHNQQDDDDKDETTTKPNRKQVERSASNVTANSETTLTPVPQRDLKIQANTAHMLWFSGLRGAVAYACVRSFPDTFNHEREFTSTTMMIVLITVFVMGGATEAVLKMLNIEMNVNEDQYMEAWRRSDQAPVPGFWTFFDKRMVLRYVVRDYDMSASSRDDLGISPSASNDSATNPKRPQREGSSRVSSNSTNTKGAEMSRNSDPLPDIEVTESTHYDTLQEMGLVPLRRKTSLFDYGLKKSE
ncbi:Sodium/hydrogen exchanger [Seminavis robusta]|uniref:Sodium/hydrogen exchanger 8 n=1 Tax=Seminavis robusta TaxID=568900 RepID=A0A9N8DZL3_9STRA|nr:Sodium/hydrogen exchanger [Seminavis robusta]|eukprot:Sro417_g138730.1 Sodium/hydrogen exchanger (712) ;mRNA; r:41023-43259